MTSTRIPPRVGPTDPCVECGGPRKPERSRRYGKQEAERDPFCSTLCARSFYGTELKPASGSEVQSV